MNERRRAYVAGNYVHLQGFRFIPLGIVCLAIAGWHLGWLRWVPLAADFSGRVAVVLVICAVIVSYVIKVRVYELRFGSALPRHPLGIPGVLIAAIVCIAAGWLQTHFPTTVRLPALVVTFSLLWVSIRARGLRNHYLALGAVWALLVVTPLPHPQTRAAVFYGMIGISLIIGGIGDHRVLMRILRSVV